MKTYKESSTSFCIAGELFSGWPISIRGGHHGVQGLIVSQMYSIVKYPTGYSIILQTSAGVRLPMMKSAPKALLLLLCLVVAQLAQLNPWHNADQNQSAGDKDGPQPHLQLVLVESGLGGRRDRDQRHE